MEFQIMLSGRTVDLDALRERLEAIDPGAVADISGDGRTLRISAETSTGDLARLAGATGLEVKPSQVLEVPAFCCGGCGG